MTFFRSLTGRLILVAVLGLVPFAVLEFYYLSQIRDQVAERAADQAQTLARAIAAQHRSLLEAAALSLEQIALMEPVRTGDGPACSARLAEVRQATVLFLNLARGTADGRVDCSARPGQTRLITAAMPAVAETLRRGVVSVGQAAISPNHGKPIIPLTRQLPPGPDGEARVLVAGASLPWLDRVVSELTEGSEALVLVLDENNTILAAQPSIPSLIGTPLGGRDMLGEGQALVAELADNQRRQVFVSAFEGGIRVAVGIPQDQVLTTVGRSLMIHGSGFALTAFGSLLLVGLTSHILFRRRFQRFAAVAAQIAQGDFSARIAPDRFTTDEFHQFANTFNVMAATIAQRDQTLKAANAELEAARDAADRANRAKSEFLSSMSHELRTPLNIVLGYSQLLEISGGTLPPKTRSYIAAIQSGAQILLRLIDEVLDLAKIEAGRIALSLSPVAIIPTLEELVNTMQPLAEKAQVTLRLAPIPQGVGLAPMLSADPGRLSQILMNLVSNAIKYNTVGGKVDVFLESGSEGRLRISVRDTGLGIPKEVQSKVFQPFNRLGAERGKVAGTGIGLTIARRLVEAMSGRIGFSSTLGEGSTFWLELPQALPDKNSGTGGAACPLRRGQERAAQGGFRALYVEDSPENTALLADLLATLPNVTLFTAATARHGLDTAMRQRPDVIILDVNLPDMDGYCLLAELKARPETQHIPVLALSASAMPLDSARGLAAGFFRYLTKPLVVEEFMAALGEALRAAGVYPAREEGTPSAR